MKSRTLALHLAEMPTIEREPSWDGWIDCGQQLKEYERTLNSHVNNYQLIVGAWYNYGIEHWRRPAERAARELGFSKETIQNWAWVERHTPASLRGDGLSFEHYRAAAALPGVTERAEWLEKAKSEKLSGGELRRQIAQARGKSISPRTAQERKGAEQDALGKLIDELITDGNTLLAKPDELSRAQGDVYLDCAERIRNVIEKG